MYLGNNQSIRKDFCRFKVCKNYPNNHKYFDRQAWANSVDPDQTPQNAASDQGLRCLSLNQQFLETSKSNLRDSFKIKYSKELWCPNAYG